MEFSYAVDVERALDGVVGPAAAEFRLHGKRFDGANFAGPPSHDLSRIDQRLEDAVGRSGDVDLADDRVLIGSDDGRSHKCSLMSGWCFASKVKGKTKSTSTTTDRSVRPTTLSVPHCYIFRRRSKNSFISLPCSAKVHSSV